MRAGSFRVRFQKAISIKERLEELKINERQLKALSFAAEIGNITLAEYAQIVKMPRRTLQRDLQGLVKNGFLVKHGNGKTTRYERGK